MVTQKMNGVFLGRARVATKKRNGSVRNINVDFQGLKNDLVYVLWGGTLANPFPGAAKLYEGDMFYQELDDKAQHPKLYCLKVYEAAATSAAKTIKLVRDGFRHKIFPGDTIMVEPATIGGKGKIANVTAVADKTETDGSKIWEVTVDTALTITKGDILVEGKALSETDGQGNTGEMLVKDINCFAPQDYDFVFEPVADPADVEDFENAEYQLTPVVGVLGLIHKMSPIPKCVLKLNQSRFNGIFAFNALHASV